MTTQIEIVTYELEATADKAQLLATNPAMEAFLNQQPGFLYRSLSCDEQGLWFEIIYWESAQAAKAGAEAFMQSEVAESIMPLLNSATCKMRLMSASSEVLSESLGA